MEPTVNWITEAEMHFQLISWSNESIDSDAITTF